MAAYALGIDIGGTFTDIVLYDYGSRRALGHKELTTPAAPSRGVISGIRHLFDAHRIGFDEITRVVHATTLFSNALIERKGAPTGLITTAGFRDTLELRRENKYELYDLFIELPPPLVPRSLRLEVAERIGPTGAVETALDREGLLAQVAALKERGVVSLAVVFLHAYANPTHEIEAGRLIAEHFPALSVSLSCEVSPQIREFERSSTTAANAYVKPLAASYLDLMRREIAALGIRAPLFMMLSNGGLTHIDEAKRLPIQLLESGPAAGALAGAFFSSRSHIPDVLAFDMGGTTAKLAIVEAGRPLVAHHFEASREKRFTEGSGLPISISTIELIEIGAGGGSIATIDALGLLKVGPRSAGAAPGPACYGNGGTEPTVTDANLVLGFLDPANFAGGTIAISQTAAETAIRPLAARAGVSVPELAWGIHSVVNETMAAAARVHVAERGHHAGDFALLVTGGGGPLHGCEVAQRLGIARIVCPPSAGVASALGLLMAPARIDRVTTIAKRLSALDWAALERTFAALERDAGAVIEATVPGAATDTVRAGDLRFVGQGFELITTLPPGPYDAGSAAAFRDAFTSSYRQTFGQVPPGGEIELINIRVAVSARVGQSELEVGGATAAGAPVARTRRPAWVGTGNRFVEMPVYDRLKLGIGAELHGPAIIEEASSTLILPPDACATVDDAGNIVVELPPRAG